MQWKYIAVEAEMGLSEGLPCSCCGKLETDILYFPKDWSSKQENWIKRIWNVDDRDTDFNVCENCMRGCCGANPGLNADTWLAERVEEYQFRQ